MFDSLNNFITFDIENKLLHIQNLPIMKTTTSIFFLVCIVSIFTLSRCTFQTGENQAAPEVAAKPDYNGYETREAWGEHLVTVGGCNDCHTPKKMTPHGPDLDSSLMLSGHPAQMPPPDIDRKEVEQKGLAVTQTLTAWVGPWGISYAANLTSDATGIGNWDESNFIRAIREGKYKGLEAGRDLLPPMPWQMYKHLTDDELKAIFAYLKSTKPINNVPPGAQQPVSAAP